MQSTHASLMNKCPKEWKSLRTEKGPCFIASAGTDSSKKRRWTTYWKINGRNQNAQYSGLEMEVPPCSQYLTGKLPEIFCFSRIWAEEAKFRYFRILLQSDFISMKHNLEKHQVDTGCLEALTRRPTEWTYLPYLLLFIGLFIELSVYIWSINEFQNVRMKVIWCHKESHVQ